MIGNAAIVELGIKCSNLCSYIRYIVGEVHLSLYKFFEKNSYMQDYEMMISVFSNRKKDEKRCRFWGNVSNMPAYKMISVHRRKRGSL